MNNFTISLIFIAFAIFIDICAHLFILLLDHYNKK